MQDIIQNVLKYMPNSVKDTIYSLNSVQKSTLKEIRLRLQRPFMLNFGDNVKFYQITTKDDILYVTNKLSDYSLNSVKESLCRGFITVAGGIRVGIAGEFIIQNREIKFIHNINGLNFRIPLEKKGAADGIIKYVYDGKTIFNTLIISPPMMGKTTLLRDIARQLSAFVNVCIIDERSEIASCVNSVPSFDVGPRTDIIDSLAKAQAITMAVRSLSPDVILTDEIGSESDCNALFDAAKSGVSFVASVHAKNKADAIKRSGMTKLFENEIVKRLIILGKNNIVGSIDSIIEL